MSDKARKLTDKELADMEAYIEKLYKDSYATLSKDWDKYMTSHKAKLNEAFFNLVEANKSGDKDEIAKAKEEYERTAKNLTVNNKRFQDMSAETSAKLSRINEVAIDYVNDRMPSIYTTNYNAFGDEHIKGYSFSLVNENAIRELATKDSAFLPLKKIDIPKDIAWNQKMINSQMFQGILLGENVTKLASRLRNVTDMDKNSSIRNARTMTTATENKGRQDSFKKAESDGVIMKRRWVATHDERTRAWHSDLDGVEVDINEPWTNDFGEIMYPGDPTADPANVYNCRCSIRSVVKGFKWDTTNVEQPEVSEERNVEIMHDLVSSIVSSGNVVDAIYECIDRMNVEDVKKFNKIFKEAKFVDNGANGSYYDPVSNTIYLSSNDGGYAIFHESTHWFDGNQKYIIQEDRGMFKYVLDENGDLTNEREWVSKMVTVKEDADFSEYIHHQWTTYEVGHATNAASDDMQNIIDKLHLSGTYGYNRKAVDIQQDLHNINTYLQEKGIDKTDPDFIHLSDFMSAMTYDSNMGSAVTGGHDYAYWVSDEKLRIAEITASYNVLRALGRTDLIAIERELAPALMKMIEEEWMKIW